MSKIEVDTIVPQSGTTLTVGEAGDTVDISNATLSANLNANNLTSGTIPDARFPATLPAVDGSNLTSLNANNISTGTLSTSRLPTVPTTKGGTGLTTIGTAGQALVVNGGGTALEYGDVSVDLSAVAQSVIPSTTDTYDLGSSSKIWANIYTGDLNLNNEAKGANDIDGTTGSWTIQEGADDLYLLNNKSGKKYKFKLEEI